MSGRNGKVRVLIAAKERHLRDQLRQLVTAEGQYEIAGVATDGQEAVQLATLLSPDIVLVKADLPIFNGLEAAEMIGLCVPDVRCVLLGNGQPDLASMREAMKSGLRAYIPSPIDDSELLATIESLASISTRRETPEYRTATDPSLLPKVIVVTGGKGGIGKTTIAASIATCLVNAHPGKVVLFDLYTQFGDVATMLDIAPQRSLSDMAAMADEIDLETLEGYMVEHVTGMKVLVSSLSPQPIESVSVTTAENTLHALKRAYTHIVVDMPPILHPTTLYVLSSCYQVLLVTNCFDMPTLRNARELSTKIAGSYVPEEKIAVIANRVSKHDRLRLDDVERMLGRPIAAQVPNDPRLVSAINQGVPFIKAYWRSPMAAAVRKIAQDIIQSQPVERAHDPDSARRS